MARTGCPGSRPGGGGTRARWKNYQRAAVARTGNRSHSVRTGGFPRIRAVALQVSKAGAYPASRRLGANAAAGRGRIVAASESFADRPAGGAERRQKREPRYTRAVHAGDEAQREQRADFHAGKCRIAAAVARAALLAVAGADQDHAQYGAANQ